MLAIEVRGKKFLSPPNQMNSIKALMPYKNTNIYYIGCRSVAVIQSILMLNGKLEKSFGRICLSCVSTF